MLRTAALSLLASTALVTGCMTSERDLAGYDENGYVVEDNGFVNDLEQYGNLDVGDATTRGSMGPVRDISGQARASGYTETDYTTVDLVTTNANGAAMHMLSIYGDLDQLERGRTYTFSSEEWPSDPDAVYANSINCSTDTGEAGDWDYDVEARNVSLTVEDGQQEGELVIDYETVADDGFFGEDVSGGQFILRR